MLDDLRMGLFTWLLKLLIYLVPKSEHETWLWLAKLPWPNQGDTSNE